MSNSIRVLAEEHPTYFLCSRRDIPSLVAKAEAEAEQILKEFSAFYKTAGELTIKIEPVQYLCGFGIGGKLLWDGEPILEESDCGLLFLHLNEVILNRMLQLGIPSFDHNGEMMLAEIVPQVPGQVSMEGTVQEAPKILKLAEN